MTETETQGFRFLVAEAAECLVLHEALMSYRNREIGMAQDVLRREAADRMLARMDAAIWELDRLLRASEALPQT